MALCTLSGAPLNTQFFSRLLGRSCETLQQIGTPLETGQSTTVKLQLQLESDTSHTNSNSGTKNKNTSLVDRFLFLKTIDASKFDKTKSLSALRRDLISNRNEATFYLEFASELCERGVPIATILHVEEQNHEHEEDESLLRSSGYQFIFECVDESLYFQTSPLDVVQAQASLLALAKLHASSWEDESLLRAAESTLHARAGYWALPTRGNLEIQTMLDHWPGYVQAFRSHDEEWFDRPATLALAQRLACISDDVAKLTAPASTSPFACLVHGDYKAMNLFIPRTLTASDNHSAILIDFQWTSIGYGMCDVAMHLFHSVNSDALQNGGDQRLLRFYYDSLMIELARQHTLRRQSNTANTNTAHHDHGKPHHDHEKPQQPKNDPNAESDSEYISAIMKRYSWEIAQEHYTLALLDYARIVFGSFFKAASPELFRAKASNMNCGLPYRDVKSSLFFVKQVDKSLRQFEATKST
eukprot:m.70254 g.70254  ORF g.70254 m.70254 type:complete len:471 (-) comp24199_c0_seq1:165-1577(-)